MNSFFSYFITPNIYWDALIQKYLCRNLLIEDGKNNTIEPGMPTEEFRYFVLAINKLRTFPELFSEKLKLRLKQCNCFSHSRASLSSQDLCEECQEIHKAVEYLNGCHCTHTLQWNESLSAAAQAHANWLGKDSNGSIRSPLAERISRHGDWTTYVGENVIRENQSSGSGRTGPMRRPWATSPGLAEKVDMMVLEMLVCEGGRHRENLLSQRFHFLGIGGCFGHEKEFLRVLNFAGDFGPCIQKARPSKFKRCKETRGEYTPEIENLVNVAPFLDLRQYVREACLNPKNLVMLELMKDQITVNIIDNGVTKVLHGRWELVSESHRAWYKKTADWDLLELNEKYSPAKFSPPQNDDERLRTSDWTWVPTFDSRESSIISAELGDLGIPTEGQEILEQLDTSTIPACTTMETSPPSTVLNFDSLGTPCSTAEIPESTRKHRELQHRFSEHYISDLSSREWADSPYDSLSPPVSYVDRMSSPHNPSLDDDYYRVDSYDGTVGLEHLPRQPLLGARRPKDPLYHYYRKLAGQNNKHARGESLDMASPNNEDLDRISYSSSSSSLRELENRPPNLQLHQDNLRLIDEKFPRQVVSPLQEGHVLVFPERCSSPGTYTGEETLIKPHPLGAGVVGGVDTNAYTPQKVYGHLPRTRGRSKSLENAEDGACRNVQEIRLGIQSLGSQAARFSGVQVQDSPGSLVDDMRSSSPVQKQTYHGNRHPPTTSAHGNGGTPTYGDIVRSQSPTPRFSTPIPRRRDSYRPSPSPLRNTANCTPLRVVSSPLHQLNNGHQGSPPGSPSEITLRRRSGRDSESASPNTLQRSQKERDSLTNPPHQRKHEENHLPSCSTDQRQQDGTRPSNPMRQRQQMDDGSPCPLRHRNHRTSANCPQSHEGQLSPIRSLYEKASASPKLSIERAKAVVAGGIASGRITTEEGKRLLMLTKDGSLGMSKLERQLQMLRWEPDSKVSANIPTPTKRALWPSPKKRPEDALKVEINKTGTPVKRILSASRGSSRTSSPGNIKSAPNSHSIMTAESFEGLEAVGGDSLWTNLFFRHST